MSDEPSPMTLAQVAAARLGGCDWQLDAEPEFAEVPDTSPDVTTQPPILPTITPTPHETPPLPLQGIIEAMLFAGGPPLTSTIATTGIRGLTPDGFREVIDSLAKKYREQRRPYAVRPRGDGFVLTARPEFRWVKDRLHGGPREARLNQPALDVLSLVAYRQPIAKTEIDALRGADAGPSLRQLIRLGLVAAGQSGSGYSTTPRFLDLLGLSSLDDLPRLVDTGP